MEIKAAKDFCKEFYKRFSSLDLHPFQLEYTDSADACSIALITHDEKMDIEAAIVVDEDSISILKINCFEDVDCFFKFDTPLELYTNLLTLMLACCQASKVFIPPVEALNVTLCHKIKTWRELVVYLCSLSPEWQVPIVVQESCQNALKILKTSFHIYNSELVTDGLYRSKAPYKDILGMIHAVLDAVSAVLKIHDYEVNPLSGAEGSGRSF